MEEKVLHDEEILNIIENYTKDKSEQAILIDGDWGVGKTFFIKNKVIKKLEGCKKVIYISLYGVSSVEEINKLICMRLLKLSGVIEISENMSKIVKGISMVLKVSGKFDMNEYSDLFELIDKKDIIFFIDDLERCNISINEILGYINELLENNKVIIIANQAEIGMIGS